MRLLKNFKLGTKVIIGFGALFILLLITILFSYMGLRNINRDFTYYRKITTTDVLASSIQTSLLETRMAYKNFVHTGNSTYHRAFDDQYGKMEESILELQSGIDDGERKKESSHILEHAKEYKDDFNRVVVYKDKRTDLYHSLTVKGPAMEKNLSQIVERSYKEKDDAVSLGANRALKFLLLSRLEIAKLLESDDLDGVDLIKDHFAQVDKWLEILKKNTPNTSYEELLGPVVRDKELYYNDFLQIVTVIEERDRIIKTMDEIGPEISAKAENIKLSINEEQDDYGPRVKRRMDFSVVSMLLIVAISMILSILIAIEIIKTVVIPVRAVTNTFKEVSQGQTDVGVRLQTDSQDELGEMAKYFNTFMERLQEILDQNKNQSWLKTGQTELNEKTRGEQDIPSLANNIITYVTKYMNASIGAFYLNHGDDVYKLVGSYAYDGPNSLRDVIKPGEGLIGQCILEKQPILLTDIPDDYIKINSAMGDASPAQIVVIPCLFEGQVNCVMELGSFSGFTPIQMEFLTMISESIAISIHSQEARAKVQHLLDKSIIQSEELQVQQEELRQSNEELEEYTMALKESEARLQGQQEELRAINEELEERTRSLEHQKNDINKKNEDLINIQREIEEKARALEAASRYKSEFLANMSHELRTPLNSILVLSQLLANKKENEPLTPKQREFAKTIYASGSELLNLISDILDLSKVEAGKLAINPENISIHELVESIQRSFGQIALDKNLDFSVEIAEDIPEYMVTDGHRLHQILNNLLSNAFKFTEKGEVKVNIGRPDPALIKDQQAAYENTISFVVADTGIGIPKDKQNIIFEAFMQSDGTTSRKYGGTGLGLSISRELARLLGGRMYLSSETKKGSVFTLLLPMKNEKIVEDQVATGKEEISITTVIAAGDDKDIKDGAAGLKSLLIIEDDPVFSMILKDLAIEKGYDPMVADSGEKAMKLSIEKRPDAILMDIGLPGISGWEVINQLRNDPKTEDIPVHIISGKDVEKGDRSRSGIVGYLKKPVSINKLDRAFKDIESAIEKPFKKLLVVGENKGSESSIGELIGKKDIVVSYAKTGQEAYDLIKTEGFDCVILEMNLEDISGIELLTKLQDHRGEHIPAIVYTDNHLTEDDEMRINKYAKSIIVKGSRSMERLLGEVNLFLHGLENKKGPLEQKNIKENLDHKSSMKGPSVLIVDDDMRNVFALTGILEDAGIKVVVGRNGREGIHRLHENSHIDLVLMDIMMPEMDGYGAIKEIRKDQKYQNLPIIALTAKAMKEDRRRCIEAGADDYMTKPIDGDRLLSLLRVWLYK